MQNLGEIRLPRFLEQLNPEVYLNGSYTVFDFETTNRDKGSAVERTNRVVLSTWLQGPLSGGKAEVRYDYKSELDQGRLLESIRSSGFVVAHHAKFDLQWGSRCGLDLGTILVWDTLIGEYVLAGNRRVDLSLEGTARRYGLGGKVNLVSSLITGGICPSEIPENWLIEYGCEDTRLCHEVFLRQREEIVRLGLLPVMFTRCLLTPVLADIEMNGVQLDPKRVEEKYNEVRKKVDDLQVLLQAESGDINWDSPKQVAGYLYDTLGFGELRTRDGKPDRTGAGGRRTDAEAIQTLHPETEKQRKFKDLYTAFRPLDTQLATLGKLLACCNESGGKLHANFNQSVTQTHRLSSSGKKYKVQFQNIDRTLKKLFCASKSDWLVGESDGSQLEFRVAAHCGRDEVALSDIRNPKFDAHYQTAEKIKGKAREDIGKDERDSVKPKTFRPLYGGDSGTKEEKAYYQFFRDRYNGIFKTQEGWTYTVLQHKQLRTETGLIFYWPDTEIKSSRDGRRTWITNRTSIFNYPIQSLATADIIPIAIVYMWHYMRALGLKMFLVNTIHDSVIVELPPEEEEIFCELASYCFTSRTFDYLLRVYGIKFVSPLGCESKVGTHWSEGKGVKYDLDPLEYFKEAA